MDGIDLNMADYMKFVLAFIFVMGLIALVTFAARRMGFGLPAASRNAAHRRLGIVEALNVDGKRRMVLVRRDDTEHLLLLGAGTETVIERGITPPENAFSKALNDAVRVTSDEQERHEPALTPQGPPLPSALRPSETGTSTEDKS